MLKRWDQKLLKVQCSDARCDSVTRHRWLIGRGEIDLGQDEINTLAKLNSS